MRQRVLITGVNGFIGSALWRHLKKKDTLFDVYGLDIKLKGSEKHIIRCNLKHHRKLRAILLRVEPAVIFHFAGGRITNVKKLLESNYLTTKILMDTVRGIPGYSPRIIIPGTAAEYGKVPATVKRITESHPTRPVSQYGKIKLKQTGLALRNAQKGMDVVVARIFNIIGANTPPTLAIGHFAKQIVNIERKKSGTIMTKNLSGRRDFLDIHDVCRALMDIARYGERGEVYNVCSTQPTVIRTALRKLLSFAKGKNIEVLEDEKSSVLSFDTAGSNRKLKRISRWTPRISLDGSLRATLQSYRSSV